jgi:branched-subunit amino acid aminotransferase/4-amino-4-deoxychorismate lyase
MTTTPSSFLSTHPRGVYTCIRLKKDGTVVGRDLHLARLQLGFQVLFSDNNNNITERKDLSQLIPEKYQHITSEQMIVILVTEKQHFIEFFPLPVTTGYSTIPSTILLGGGKPRFPNPNVKDSQWIQLRAPQDRLKSQFNVTEVILSDEIGNLYEGLITNLFIIKRDGSIETAPNHTILCGTMREFALLACETLGIPIILRCPQLHEIDLWDSAFLTSVSKPCSIVHE